MEPDYGLIKKYEEKSRKDYAENYKKIKWLTEEEVVEFNGLREDLLNEISLYAETGFGGTKTDVNSLSPGCRLCGEGSWSCLFINGKCNCRCFYCPASQDEIGVPTTNLVQFQNPRDYVDYLKAFGFKGVSLSGGEPLLTFEKSLNFINAVKEEFKDEIYLWMYTNGTLVTDEILFRLKRAGLDELRFDIGAINYNTDKAKKAAKIIDRVTVEIPAVPEDFELMKAKMKELSEAGVKHLNLHQLRLTNYNAKNLLERNYRYIRGEKAVVLESEITALRLIKETFDSNINLPVNYCSFIYKNRYQRSAARKRSAKMIKRNFEEITENGYIRTINIYGDNQKINNLKEELIKKGFAEDQLGRYPQNKLLILPLKTLGSFDYTKFEIGIKYNEAIILSNLSYGYPFKRVELNSKKSIFVERIARKKEYILSEKEKVGLQKNIDLVNGNKINLAELKHFESLEKGFQKYY